MQFTINVCGLKMEEIQFVNVVEINNKKFQVEISSNYIFRVRNICYYKIFLVV